ncbi:secreted RxLR effector protein 161 [Lathyrus oleraceus]|uniref:secreted RxLR effector protein 161 n=1 Tax=Pisum sativum TaxID=3888 RepID=UPI0021D24D6F|nr:secreted RxLR effector protein 161-like [Pisum sativum]
MDNLTSASLSVKPNLKLEEHGKEHKVDTTFFKKIVGSLRYVCNSLPDIGFSVGLVSKYLNEPKVSHMKAVRRILRYLKGSINYEILFQRDSERKEASVTFYLDAYWYGYKEDLRSTTGYFFQVFGAPFSWCSRKKLVMELSS